MPDLSSRFVRTLEYPVSTMADMTDIADSASRASDAPEPVWPVPSSLSPSRVSSFTSCPMQFRFSSVQRLPEPPSIAATRGSIVHRALELLFELPNAERLPAALQGTLATALDEYATDPDYVGLHLDQAGAAKFRTECDKLIEKYFEMEDPTQIREIGLEIRMAAEVGSLELRGIIDRLELDENGDLIVTDYKTGRAPSGRYEQKSLAGVHFYSFLCEAVLGKRPAKIRLMYLSNGETIETTPSAQSVRFINTRTNAVWKAVERACTTGDFRPNQSKLCDWCSFQRWCPAFGGNPDLAATEAVAAHEALLAGESSSS
jgi:putative RecB family exonuclease